MVDWDVHVGKGSHILVAQSIPLQAKSAIYTLKKLPLQNLLLAASLYRGEGLKNEIHPILKV